MTRPATAALLAALFLAGCDTPPPEAYATGGRGPVAAAARPSGANTEGEPCVLQPGRALESDPAGARPYEIFCGSWRQPSARLLLAASGDPDALVAGGTWRRELDQRAACGPPRRTSILSGDPALVLDCTRRAGGWPHIALVTRSPAGTIMADGVLPSLPAIEAAAAVLAGGTPPGSAAVARSAALALVANRLATQSFSSRDIGEFEELMRLGNELNQAENFADAENAYRAALALHERVLGPGNPGGAGAAMSLALQLSNQGRILEADALLARAGALAPASTDPLLPGRLLHYRAMHAGNQGSWPEAERLVARAEAELRTHLPEDMRAGRRRAVTAVGVEPALGDRALLADAAALRTLAAYIEARRYHAVVLHRLGRAQEAEQASREALSLAHGFTADSPVLAARAARTEGVAARSEGDAERAAALFMQSARLFARAVPDERPVALAQFRAGAALAASGRQAEALAAFRDGARILGERRLGLSADAVMPYLDLLAAMAGAAPEPAPLTEEMFEAAQLIRGGITARLIAQATARLGAAGGAAGAAGAIRKLQEAEDRLAELYAERDTAAAGGGVRDPQALAALDLEITKAQAARASAELAVQAAAPGYRQLVLGTTTAAAARARLGEGEALALIVAGPDGGHTLLLDRQGIASGRIGLGEERIGALVARVRASIELHFDGPGGSPRLPEFDTASAHALWRALFGPLASRLGPASRLIVVPSGALLSLPFGLLPVAEPATGPPDWLIDHMAVTHMPSVQSFVSLREAAAPSRARNPYLGFGDFVPPSQQAIAASFPRGRCESDAAAIRSLRAIPGTRAEIEAARRLLGAPATDVVMGQAFTPAAVRARPLADFRVIHFAAHAVLPSEIHCLAEPAILASTPPGESARAAFIPASEILGFRMDADLAILSACNSGGEAGGAGESLSGLARAFFYAGVRGLIVTHWSVDDTASALLVADTLRRLASGTPHVADALRDAQRGMIADARSGRLPAVFAHPFFWAGFALVGDGGVWARAGRMTGDPSAAAPMPL